MPDDAPTQHRSSSNVTPAQHAARHSRLRGTYWTLLLTGILTAAELVPAADPAPKAKPPASRPTTGAVQHSAAARLVAQFQSHLRTNDTAAATKLLAAFPQPLHDTDRRL